MKVQRAAEKEGEEVAHFCAKVSERYKKLFER